MIFTLIRRAFEPSPRLLWNFLWKFGWNGMRAVNAFKRRLKRGEVFPAFLFLSITNSCNLKCRGCWVSQSSPPDHLSLETLDRVIDEAKEKGCRFFGILGGEPLLHPDLFRLLEAHRDCYFQVFTNGTFLDAEVARKFRRLGNVTPLISIEGDEVESDIRRGGKQVYSKALAALENCRRERLIFGVATSVCKGNIDTLMREEFARQVADLGALYLWYYLYRPVGPQPSPELALDPEQIREMRRFIVDLRMRAPLAILDAYWDHNGEALCPAATGISHHLNPRGDVEPCPVIQFARENVGEASLETIFSESDFLADFRKFAAGATRGCVLLEKPEELKKFMEEHGARDTTGRGTGFAELAAMCPHHSHHFPGEEIPEKHWAYRLAKKFWFFGFGAYG